MRLTGVTAPQKQTVLVDVRINGDKTQKVTVTFPMSLVSFTSSADRMSCPE